MIDINKIRMEMPEVKEIIDTLQKLVSDRAQQNYGDIVFDIEEVSGMMVRLTYQENKTTTRMYSFPKKTFDFVLREIVNDGFTVKTSNNDTKITIIWYD